MKKIFILGIVLVMLFSVSMVASALTLDKTDITLGSNNQKRSNPLLDEDEAGYNEYDSEVIILRSNTTTTVNVEYPTNSIYDITFPGTTFPLTLTANVSKTITIKARIPENWPSYWKESPSKVKDTIGNLVFKNAADAADSVSAVINMQAENQLTIDKVYISVNGLSKKSYEADDTVEKLKPADELEITVRVENSYDDEKPEDINFEDVEVSILDDSKGFDIDDDDTVDVDAKSTEDIKFEVYEIAFDVEDGSSDLVVTAYGEDENGAVQGQQIKMKLEVEKEDDDIAIKNIVYPVEITCDLSSLDLSFTLVNVGGDDQDQVETKVTSTDFEFDERRKEISLDEGDDEDLTFTIPIPEDMTAGTKKITITSYYNRISKSNEEYVTLTMPDCTQVTPVKPTETEEDEEETEDNTVVITQPKDDKTTTEEEDTVAPIIAGNQPITTVESGFASGNMYIVVLAVAVIIAIAAFALSLAVVFKKR